MNANKAVATILLTALPLGLAGDLLLRRIPWGVNVFLWTALLVVAAWLVRRSAGSAPLHAFAATSSLLLAAGIAWRDSAVLVALDAALLALFLPMLALNARNVRVAAAGLVRIAGAVITTVAQSVAGFPQLLACDVSWERVPSSAFRRAGVAARGTAMATPALIVFTSLLTSADQEFERVLRNLFAFDLGDLFTHVVVTLVVAALCAGFLRSLTLGDPFPRFDDERLITIPAAETNFALTLINLLFAVFVAVQFRYFFGTAAVSAAAYARRGFFELVWVVALVLPMLLLLDWMLEKKTLFRVLAAIQVALVFVIAGSAWHRMQLYREAFGLTRLRLFTTAFMVWIAVLLLWFVLTVLTGRRHRFAVGALASAVAAVMVLHAINPDALIVRTNLARARDGARPFDANYALALSDDAVPEILANAHAFDRRAIDRLLSKPRPDGWRTWNAGRARATKALQDLRRVAPPEPEADDAVTARAARRSTQRSGS